MGSPEFRAAVRQAGAVWAGFFAMALGLGIVVAQAGLPWWVAPMLSGLVYAGSMEFIMIGLLTGGASWGTIAVTTFFTNSRHIFYGLTYPLHTVRGWWARAYAVFTLADETYALVSALPADARTSRRILTITAGLHLHWLAGSTVGAVFASHMLGTIPGLDFILVGLFTVLAMDALAQSRDVRTAGLAAACAAVGLVVAPHHMLLVAMALFAYACSTIPAGRWLPYVVALVVTMALHWWRRNVLLSIVVGTGVCVGLSLLQVGAQGG